MQRPLDVLQNVKIASPCSQPWHKMEGDDRVRFCNECRLNVYNLSEMNAKDAAALVQSTEGRLCVGYYMRADGSIITRDCPVGIRAVRKKLLWTLSAAAAALGFALAAKGSLAGVNARTARLRYIKPIRNIANLIDPPRQFLAGLVAVPPPGPPAPPTR